MIGKWLNAGVMEDNRTTYPDIRIPCLEIGFKWSRPMVELGSVSYESGISKEVL